jgi:ATP-dependent RNA helicase SUPV3L1/SUV3
MRRFVRDVEHVSRPRFSTLSHTGHKKVTRLPPRSAVVAFTLADVFSLAEVIRRRRGGTAVVLGALSPRARNAQVGMFQAGEVDYLVATDAIGMGLNMDLDHVAFARIDKFDGRGPRRLNAAEIAQIAGRAGRHMSDGTFGTTAEQRSLDPEIVEAVESHRFDPLTQLNWRSTRLRFESVAALLKSLDQQPSVPGLVQAREADDHRALRALARTEEIAALAVHPGAVRLLWEVCQIPDFRKVLSDSHTRLLGQCFIHLARPAQRLPTAWIAGQMVNLDSISGDIDALMARIAHIRTWTYITNRSDWVEDAGAWQDRARSIEDRLSDALHDRITQRFVDQRSTFLVRQLACDGELPFEVSEAGEIHVAGTYVGRLNGLRFEPDARDGAEARMLIAAAGRVVRHEVTARAHRLLADPDDAFAIDSTGSLIWRGGFVGRLVAGKRTLAPRAEPFAADFVEGELRERIRQRLQTLSARGDRTAFIAAIYGASLSVGGNARGLSSSWSVHSVSCRQPRSVRRSRRSIPWIETRWVDRASASALRASISSRFFAPIHALSCLAQGGATQSSGATGTSKRPPGQGDRSRSSIAAFVLRHYRVAPICLAMRPDRLGTRWAARHLTRRGPVAMGELAAISGISRQRLRQLLVALGYRAVAEAGGEALLLGLAVDEKAAIAVHNCRWTTVTRSPSYES